MDFVVPNGQQSENQRKRKGRWALRPCQRTKKKPEQHEGDAETNCYCQFGTVPNQIPWRMAGGKLVDSSERSPVNTGVKNSQGIIIHWEMCRKFQFDQTNKWYMHNPAPVLENDTHKLLWDFDIQMDHLIPARRPDLIIINNKKENLQNCRLCCPGRPQNKSEGKWIEG